MTNARIAFLFSFCCLLATPVLAQIGGGTCTAANLSGTYALSLSGRGISAAGSFTGSYQGGGTATFDGVSAVTFTGNVNTNLAAGKAFTYMGSYTVPSNCYGTITLTTGSTATFALVVWNNGRQFNITGSDANYVYSGTGTNFVPAGCSTATLSGEFIYDASGFTLSGTAQTGGDDEAGVFQFDGQGNVTASYTITSSGTTPSQLTSTGTYTVTSACLATATLTDSNGKSNALNFVIDGTYGNAFILQEANSGFVRTGSGHSAYSNPTQSIGNVASYQVNGTPPGSVFALFGFGLATKEAGAVTVPLPTTLLTTTVTVNGELAPLFYVNANQIDAQMPWDIPGGSIATVIVKNGSATSNAAAVAVPATGTPGISVYGNGRAVVINPNGSTNGPQAGANSGDEVVAYFTGGGPVLTAGKLTTGAGAPAGLSPVTGTNTVTVNGINATVEYMGLTSGSIGLYQTNFTIPAVGKGTWPVQITIAGQASNKPVITVLK